MSFQKSNGYAPNGLTQDFTWLAEYIDSTYMSEFDYRTLTKNDFYLINRFNLAKFGLVGQGMKLFFDVNTGMFNLNDHVLNFSYATEDNEYRFTGSNAHGFYSDIITFKDAHSDADLTNNTISRGYSTNIHQYNFGYKKKFAFDDGTIFNFQVLVCLPYNKPAYVEIKIVPNKNLDGNLLIKKVGAMTEKIEAPLNKEYAGICQWIIR